MSTGILPAGKFYRELATSVPDKVHECKAWWANTGIALGADDSAVTRAIRNGEASLNEVLTIECVDGMQKTILNSAVPMRDHTGQIIGAVALNEDITDASRPRRP